MSKKQRKSLGTIDDFIRTLIKQPTFWQKLKNEMTNEESILFDYQFLYEEFKSSIDFLDRIEEFIKTQNSTRVTLYSKEGRTEEEIKRYEEKEKEIQIIISNLNFELKNIGVHLGNDENNRYTLNTMRSRIRIKREKDTSKEQSLEDFKLYLAKEKLDIFEKVFDFSQELIEELERNRIDFKKHRKRYEMVRGKVEILDKMYQYACIWDKISFLGQDLVEEQIKQDIEYLQKLYSLFSSELEKEESGERGEKGEEPKKDNEEKSPKLPEMPDDIRKRNTKKEDSLGEKAKNLAADVSKKVATIGDESSFKERVNKLTEIYQYVRNRIALEDRAKAFRTRYINLQPIRGAFDEIVNFDKITQRGFKEEIK